jgi:hypothetical protein
MTPEFIPSARAEEKRHRETVRGPEIVPKGQHAEIEECKA